MGFMGSLTGKAGAKAAGYAPQSDFKAEYKAVGDDQRKAYADKIYQAQSGQGPSVANQYVANAQNAALQNAQAVAASARGGVNPALAQRLAAQAAAQGSQQAVQQGALMRAQEGTDMTKMYEQLGMQGDLANQQAFGQTQQLNANVALGNLDSQSGMAKEGMQQAGKAIGGIMSGASMAMMSDEKLKKDISSATSDIREFLDAVKAHKYKYKNPEQDGEGEFVSPMAQDLEKSSIGESMVTETPRGKMVDYSKGFGALLAAQAELNDRIKKLEGKKNG
jgi:hypothetical protein